MSVFTGEREKKTMVQEEEKRLAEQHPWIGKRGWGPMPRGRPVHCKEREGRAMATVLERWAGVVVGIMGMIF